MNLKQLSDDLKTNKICTEQRIPSMERFNLNQILQDIKTSSNESLKVEDLNLKFLPHEFQLYLAESSLAGLNNIICVRTGSGKTLIAALICKYWFNQALKKQNLNKFKVAFIVPTRPLVEQQFNVFKLAFQDEFLGKIEENHSENQIKGYFKFFNVLFMTAKKLVNTIEKNSIKISDFSMIMFDECHHTDEKHPYCEIMNLYFTEKNRDLSNKMPQIIGLTASLGVGKTGEALDQLIKLCANLDCKIVSSINTPKMKLNLREKIASPSDDEIVCVESSALNQILIVQATKTSECILHELDLKGLTMKISDFEFESLINSLKIKAQINGNMNLIIACKYLLKMHLLYMKIDDLDYDYCLNECKIFIREQELVEIPNENDLICLRHFKNFINSIDCTQVKRLGNNKLDKLVEIISKCNVKNSRGLVLVKTRHHTLAIVEYLISKLHIKADRLTGKGAKSDNLMNDADQVRVLEKFRSGEISVLVATDIAQEGLDIPECSYVIRYEFVSNEIGTVQSRGRARADKSKCYLITRKGSLNERREKENRMKEHLMDEALNEWEKYDKNLFEKKFEDCQKKLITIHKSRSLDVSSINLSKKLNNSGIQVLCRNCSKFICFVNEIQHRDPIYLILLNSNIEPNRASNSFNCTNKSCSIELGRLIIFAKGLIREAFNLQIKSIKFKFSHSNESLVYCKWSKVPFFIRDANF